MADQLHEPRTSRGQSVPGAAPGIERFDRIAPIAGAWDDLADRTRAAPFTRPGWLAAWWRAFGGRRDRLEVLALYRDRRLAGVLPVIRRGGIVRSTTNDWMSGYDPPVEDAAAADLLVQALLATRPRRIELRQLPREHPVRTACVTAAGIRAFRLVDGLVERAPYVRIDGDWNAYHAALDRKLRSEIRRRRRRLSEEGRLDVEVLDGRERLDALLDEGFRLEGAAWKDAAGTAVASQARTHAFYREGARWARDRGVLRLAFLRLDGRAIAFDYCLEDAGVHYLLKIGYDPAYRKFGPGILLRHAMLERAFTQRLSRYEFLGIDLPFKREWTEAAWEKVWLRAFAPGPAGVLDHLQFTRARPWARRVLRRS